MVNKLFLIMLVLASSCGRDVNISTKKLEANSNLSTVTSINSIQEGLLLRDTKDRLIYSGVTYNVSMYSSYLALEFIAARPLNSQHQIKFKGKFRGNDVVLETIEAK